jgi:hypothetical protein
MRSVVAGVGWGALGRRGVFVDANVDVISLRGG